MGGRWGDGSVFRLNAMAYDAAKHEPSLSGCGPGGVSPVALRVSASRNRPAAHMSFSSFFWFDCLFACSPAISLAIAFCMSALCVSLSLPIVLCVCVPQTAKLQAEVERLEKAKKEAEEKAAKSSGVL